MPPVVRKWRRLGPLFRGPQYDGTNGAQIVAHADSRWPGQEIVRIAAVGGTPTFQYNDLATASWQPVPVGMHILIRVGSDGSRQYEFRMPADLAEDFAEEP